MDRMKNAKLGISFGIVNNILGIILPFISRTIILYTLGTEYLGLGTLFVSIINVLNVTELGFGAAVSILLYEPVAKNNYPRICAILNFTKKVFRVIGTIVLVAGIITMPFLKSLISGDVPNGINIYILYIIYLLNVVCSYFLAAHKRILFAANQRYDTESNIASLTLIAQYAIQIAFLLLFKNYYLYVSIILLATVSNNLICSYATKKMYPKCICKGNIDKNDVTELKRKVVGTFASKLGQTMHLSAENIIISAVLGLEILGKYSNYYFVITSIVALFAVIHNTLRPIIGNCIALEDKQVNFFRFTIFNFIYLWLVAFCACCLLCLYQDFIFVWAGTESLFPSYFAILFAIYFLFGRLSSPPVLFVEAAGLLWESKYISLLSAVMNLMLGIVSAKIFGLPGLLITSTIVSLSVNYLGYVSVLFKHYFNEKGSLLKYIVSVLMFVVVAAFCIAIVYFITMHITVTSFPTLLLKGIACACVFLVVFVIFNLPNKNFKPGCKKILKMFKTNKSHS